MGSATAFSMNYAHEFGTDWKQAVAYANEHQAEWIEVFREFGVAPRVASAIVFPELIRYSRWQDEIESAAVGAFYVIGGRSQANFSIGRFQMKPSFAEEVEAEWNKSPLSVELGFKFNLRDDADARRHRVSRLSSDEGQCRYLAMFVRLQLLRNPEIATLPAEEQVRLLATAYNRSFSASLIQLKAMQKERNFYTDMIRTHSTRFYSYSDIALAYYRLCG